MQRAYIRKGLRMGGLSKVFVEGVKKKTSKSVARQNGEASAAGWGRPHSDRRNTKPDRGLEHKKQQGKEKRRNSVGLGAVDSIKKLKGTLSEHSVLEAGRDRRQGEDLACKEEKRERAGPARENILAGNCGGYGREEEKISTARDTKGNLPASDRVPERPVQEAQ